MRKLLSLLLLLLVLTAALFAPVSGDAVYPESEHPYAANTDQTWPYTHDTDCAALKITFSADTEVESNYDFIYITDSQEQTSKYTGTALKNASIYLPGSSFSIRLTSDGSVHKQGFTITAIEAVSQTEYEDYLATPHYTISSNGTITRYSGSVSELIIPDTIDGVEVTGFTSGLFSNHTELTRVVLPEGLAYIGSNAFDGCSALSQINIPDSVTSIGSYAFRNCSSLEQITLPDGLTIIAEGFFRGCSALTQITLPDSVTTIGYAAFEDCSALTKIALPDGLTTIADWVFSGCSALSQITLPDGVASIGYSSFYNCSSLKQITLPDSVTSISSCAFRNCSALTQIVIPDSVTYILGSAFEGCSALSQIRLPEGLTSISNYLFYGCSSLTQIVIPDGVTSIGEQAFRECTSLEQITLPDGLTTIADWVFYKCSSLTELTIPDDVTSIGECAFIGCYSLTVYTSRSSSAALALSSIDYAFCDPQYPQLMLKAAETEGIRTLTVAGCDTDAVHISFPEGVTAIGSYAFNNCSALSQIVIPDSVTSIGGSAFNNCSALLQIVIPDSVTSIGNYAFYNCSSLAQITLPANITSIGARTFYSCSSLAQITIPDSVTSIGEAAFPPNIVLHFGSSDYLEQYALDNGLQYICDDKEAVSGAITTAEEKVTWVVNTYTSAGMSEYDRALRLYNWLCANAAYDYSAVDNDVWSSEYDPYSPEGALLGGWAVCQGYAEAYELLMEEAGITAHLVRGKAEYNGGGHAWNIAKIDGSWYQFDPTWDEAGNGSTHNYFGLCDAAMRSDHIQESAGHLTCNSYAANYKYVNGSYNGALSTITDTINTSISAGTYTGTISGLTSLFYSDPDPYMVACIINQADDWAISGRAEIVPDESASTFSFTFYPDEIPVSEIIIHNLEDLEPEFSHSETYWYAYPGYSIQMQAATVPAGAPITYASSDESVLTISQDGLVTAIAEGTAVITVSSGSCIRKINIAVYDQASFYLHLFGVSSADVGETIRCTPYGRYHLFLADNTLLWSSSDESIAVVDENGLVTTIGYGSAVITVQTATGYSDTVTITVCKPVTAVYFDQEIYDAFVGQNLIPLLRVEGCDQDIYNELYGYVSCRSSDSSIANVPYYYYPSKSADGTYWQYPVCIECLAPGEVILTAYAADGSGVTATCTVRIWEHAEAISLNPAQLVLNASGTGSQRRLSCTFEPENSFEHVSWSSSAPSVVSVDETGLLTAGAPGTAVITAMTGTGLQASCTVTVQTLQELLLPASLTAIEAEAFSGLALPQAVTIPKGTLTIGENAFRDCDGLLYVSLPGSLTYIAESAFSGCSKLLILCEEGSYAHSWCIANGAAFTLL